MNNKYPEYIMKNLRQRRDLEPDDISEDDDINSYSSDTAFSEVVQWNGFLGGWDSSIKGWIKCIYGIDLDSNSQGCECCEGDTPILMIKDVSVFVDSKGNFDAFVEHGLNARGKAKFCPNCGKVLTEQASEESE